MAAFPCPYCSHDLASSEDAKLERCPSCDGTLLIAYRHRLISSHGKVSGGALYEAVDDGFGERVAVLFVDQPDDAGAVERFIAGSRLFADLGGRGLVKIEDVGSTSDRRAYVIMDWLEGGTLDVVVQRRGALAQAELLSLVGDLLTGLSKAHRSMPAIVHGHIHPGKVGFRHGQQAVLFGFEWATQVNAQASQLADSFISEEQAREPRSPASDLRQLAAVFYYAATGEWIGEHGVARQRERVAAQVPGPLGRLLDRMFGAGEDGYKSAVDAMIDFDQLMRGVDSWQAPSARQDRSGERMGTAWTAPQSELTHAEYEYEDEYEDEDEDEYEDEYEEEDEAYLGSMHATSSSTPPARPKVTFAVSPPQNRAPIAAQRQAQAPAQPIPEKRVRGVIVGVATLATMGTCVAGVIADATDKPDLDAIRRGAPPVIREPAPPPYEVATPVEPPPSIEPPPVIEPPPSLEPQAELAGVFRYTGSVTGPHDFAGLALGERCEIFVEPDQGPFNCRWYIDCGEPRRRIYGGGEVGYSSCDVDEQGQPVRAMDEQDDAADGAFLADFATEPRMIIVQDRWIEPPVRVVISIEEGGAYQGSIPSTEHAPRLSEQVVQQRIDDGEWPVIEPGLVGEW